MANDLDKEKRWAEYMPSEGENPQRAAKQSSRQGVEQKVDRQASAAAPRKADPKAAKENREFVEDVAMDYDKAEEKFAKGQ